MHSVMESGGQRVCLLRANANPIYCAPPVIALFFRTSLQIRFHKYLPIYFQDKYSTDKNNEDHNKNL